MNTEYLKTFLSVITVGSFSKAEEDLFISKQAIMKQMDLLERETGVALLKRDQRGVRVTVAGTAFAKRAREMLEIESLALGEARKAGKAEKRIRLVSIDYHVLLEPVTALYNQRYPEVRVEHVFHPITLEARLVAQGLIDVGDTLFSPAYNKGNLRYEKLMEMPYFCIVPDSYSAAPLSAAQLMQTPVLLDEREFRDYYAFHLAELLRLLPHAQVYRQTDRRIAVIYQALKEGKVVITASTFARKIPDFTTVALEVDFAQECGVVYRQDAGQEVQDYVALAREVYKTK